MRRLSRSARTFVCQQLAPGGHVHSVRALKGGISCDVHAVRLEHADGTYREVVVRRMDPDWGAHASEVAVREYRLLEVLAQHSVPSPRPLLLDSDGTQLRAPGLVMTRLPGKGILQPTDVTSFISQLSTTLARVHAVPTEDLAFLPAQSAWVDKVVERGPASADALEIEVWQAVAELWPTVKAQQRTQLVHGDYWPGNVVWHNIRGFARAALKKLG